VHYEGRQKRFRFEDSYHDGEAEPFRSKRQFAWDDPAEAVDGTLSLARYSSTHLPKPILPGSDQKLPEQEKGQRRRTSAKDV